MLLTIKYLLKRYFFVLPFVVAGLYFIVIPWLTMFTFTCYRVEANQGKCFVRQTFLAIAIKEIPLESLVRAEEKGSFNGRIGSYWVILQTSTGKITLPSAHSSKAVANAVTQINSFLTDRDRKSLSVTQSDRAYSFGSGIIFLLAGALVFWIAIKFVTT